MDEGGVKSEEERGDERHHGNGMQMLGKGSVERGGARGAGGDADRLPHGWRS